MTEPPQDDHATAVRRSPEGRIAVQLHLGLTERETKWVALDAPQGQLQAAILAPETVDQWEPLTGQTVTDAQVDAVLGVLSEEVGLPYGPASIRDYVSEGSEGDERARQLAALRAADDDADAKNRAVVRRLLQVAQEASGAHPELIDLDTADGDDT